MSSEIWSRCWDSATSQLPSNQSPLWDQMKREAEERAHCVVSTCAAARVAPNHPMSILSWETQWSKSIPSSNLQTYGVCCMQPKDIHFGDPNPNNSRCFLRQRSQMRLTNAFSIDFSFHHIQLHLCFWYCQGQIPHLDRSSKVDDSCHPPGKNVKKSLKKWKAGSWFIYFGCKNPLKTRLCPTFAHFNAGFRPCDRHAQQGHAILPCDAFTRIVVVDVGHCQFFGLETQTRLLLVAASLNIFPAPEPLEVPPCLEVYAKTCKNCIPADRLSQSHLLGTQICWHCQFSTTSAAGCHQRLVIHYEYHLKSHHASTRPRDTGLKFPSSITTDSFGSVGFKRSCPWPMSLAEPPTSTCKTSPTRTEVYCCS